MAGSHGRSSVGAGGSSTPRLSFSSSGPSAPPPRKKMRASDPHPSGSSSSSVRATTPSTSQQRQTQISQSFTKSAARSPPPPATPVVVLDDDEDEEEESFATPRGRLIEGRIASGTPRTAPPAMRMLGTAPASTLRSHALAEKSSFTPAPRKAARPPVSPRKDAAEEEEWLQRAQALAGRRSRKSDGVDSADERPRARKSIEADSVEQRAQALTRKSKSRQSDGPQLQENTEHRQIRGSREDSPPSTTTADDSSTTPPPATPPSNQPTPVQETPWMHESLSGMSLLPWEMDAALKAADYRISAGLQPTRKDIEAREKLQRDLAQKAHREALMRSYGAGGKATGEAAGRKEPGRKAPRVPEQATVDDDIGDMAAEEEADDCQAPSEPTPSRQALASKPSPNQAVAVSPPRRPHAAFKPIFQSPPVSPARRADRHHDENEPATTIGHAGEQDEQAASSTRTPYALRQRGTVFSSSSRPSTDLNTPTIANPTLRSPRTNRKIYALETQGTSPLPFPLDVRPRGGDETSAPNTPRKSTLKDALLSKHASPSRRLLQQHQQRDQRTSASSSSLSSPPAASAPSSETLPLDSDYDDEVEEQGELEDDEDDDVGDDTVLAPGPCPSARQKRSLSPEQTTAGHRGASMEATQPLPFDDDEEEAALRIPLADMAEETQHLPFPPGDSETETEDEEEEMRLRAAIRPGQPTGWNRVNEAWRGVDLGRDTTGRLQPASASKQSHQAPTNERQSNLSTHGFKGHAPRTRRPNAFFSRDTHDVLSDDEDDNEQRPADDNEETQVLPWPTQSSHTEEEDEEVVAAYRARTNGLMDPPQCSPRRVTRPPPRPTTSNGSTSDTSSSSSSSWLPSSQDLHKDEHRHVRDFLRGL